MEKQNTLFIRLMQRNDLPLCRSLILQAGWNQVDEDWLCAMTLEPEGCFVAEINQTSVATTTCCRFGTTGWIAMVLVEQAHRGLGIAAQLMQHAISFLEKRGVTSICLDATAMGEKVYRKLGFEDTYEVIRFSRDPRSVDNIPLNAHPNIEIEETITTPIIKLDQQASGSTRSDFLNSLTANTQKVYYIQDNASGKVAGYTSYRSGRNAIQIGPAVATSSKVGYGLLNQILTDFPSDQCFIDIPQPNQEAIEWAISNGFTPQRSFIRMFKGDKPNDRPELIWASSGPEKG